MKKFAKIIGSITTSFLMLLISAKTSLAQIKNPAIDASIGDNAAKAADGSIFLDYFVNIWRIIINLGALMLILYLIWGAIDWITSGGDAGKVGSARNKITQAVIGMIILAFSFLLIGFIGDLFFGDNFDILNLTFMEP